ncbi:MAG TPA: circularly permuted type 2 ATP-grasp protein [Candidatus Acidoferrum sp.]|nr:circularly permuted type 2 ATP-grasp protein [Candidatus Acidoferrum sp.]
MQDTMADQPTTDNSAPAQQPVLTDYELPAERYDEMFSAPDEPRPHWQPLHDALRKLETGELGRRIQSAERQIRDSGITYNVYTDPDGLDRQWELDVLPFMIAADEWRGLEAGIAQRAKLLNAVVADLYGPQTLLKEGLVPAPLVFGHGGFLRNAWGTQPPGKHFLHLYAADLTRSPDGQWWVVADRTQAPSGAGYALENRLIVSRVFPDLFRNQNVRHLAQYFATLRDSLMQHAPRGDGTTLAVVWTPGPWNETYFEHALLARYLGFPLVEGGDLTVLNNKIWLKTIEGPRRVHAIIRRQDDTFCDPLELRADSTLGCPGLMECIRRGTVLMANAPGTGILEGGALYGYLPRLCEHLLGESLLLPSIATWWCGEPAAMEEALERADSLAFKVANRGWGRDAWLGDELGPEQLESLKDEIRAHPERYLAQELVQVSQTPILNMHHQQRLAPRGIALRLHACMSSNGSYAVMPGGLTRVSSEADARIVAMQRGGSSKDTWVLPEGPEDTQFSLLRSTLTSLDLVSSKGVLTSRGAENKYWYGRTCERCEHVARLLRVALNSVLQESEDGLSNPVFSLVESYIAAADERPLDRRLLDACTLDSEPFGLAANLRRLHHLAFQLRNRLSMDHWRTVTQLLRNPVLNEQVTLSEGLAWLDTAIVGTTTLAGYTLDNMTRDISFRFLSIGRRLERLSFLTRAVQHACHNGADSGLIWLLELCDSVITYRSRYMAQPEWLPVIDLLVRDDSNPHSLLFQAIGICDYLRKLEPMHGPCGRELLDPAIALVRELDPDRDFHPDNPRLLEVLQLFYDGCIELNARLTTLFFNNPRATLQSDRNLGGAE